MKKIEKIWKENGEKFPFRVTAASWFRYEKATRLT